MLTWQAGFFQRCIWGLVNDVGGGWGGGGGKSLSAFFVIFEEVLIARLGTNDEWGTEIFLEKKLVQATLLYSEYLYLCLVRLWYILS